MSTAHVETVSTPDGPFTLLTDGAGRVLASGWTGDVDAVRVRIAAARRPDDVMPAPAETAAAAAVRAFYDGDLDAIRTVEVWQPGTELQQAGWAALRAIPPGEPLTYTAFAAALGRPTAARAAASICARNAPALFVPCHRVLRGDGSLGGFAWGTEVKSRLLARESVTA